MSNSQRRQMRVQLTDERRAQILEKLRGHYREEFDEELSDFRAEGLLDFFVASLGPPIYNQAIQDARAYMAERLDDLDATFHEDG